VFFRRAEVRGSQSASIVDPAQRPGSLITSIAKMRSVVDAPVNDPKAK
jgi:hypothetical protein